MSGEAWPRSSDRLTLWTSNCLVNVSTRKPYFLEFILPPSLAARLAVRYQPRVVRSPAARAPGVRRWPVCCRHALVRARPVHQPARAVKAHRGGNPTATTRHQRPSPSCSTSIRHPVAPARSRSRAAAAPLALRKHQFHQQAPASS